jgi:hypothetical protein
MRFHEKLMWRTAAVAALSLVAAATVQAQRSTPGGAAVPGPQTPAAQQPSVDQRKAAAAVAQRRRELEEIRRQDVVAALAKLGVAVDADRYDLRTLTDWRDRIEAANALRASYRVDADWRATPLPALQEMRLRAAKATELSALYGVEVDWRRYTWRELEDLRRALARLRPDATPVMTRDRAGAGARVGAAPAPAALGGAAFGDGLVAPGTAGRPLKLGVRPRDPDAIIEPTFAYELPASWARSPFATRSSRDKDAILIPSFTGVRHRPSIGKDDVIDPWHRHSRGAADGPPRAPLRMLLR